METDLVQRRLDEDDITMGKGTRNLIFQDILLFTSWEIHPHGTSRLLPEGDGFRRFSRIRIPKKSTPVTNQCLKGFNIVPNNVIV
jgi:hypothetical protein